MLNFFKPWRRKAGCVTLVMACVLMVGWVRSFFLNDELQRASETSTFVAFSVDGRLAFGRIQRGRTQITRLPLCSCDNESCPFAFFH